MPDQVFFTEAPRIPPRAVRRRNDTAGTAFALCFGAGGTVAGATHSVWPLVVAVALFVAYATWRVRTVVARRVLDGQRLSLRHDRLRQLDGPDIPYADIEGVTSARSWLGATVRLRTHDDSLVLFRGLDLVEARGVEQAVARRCLGRTGPSVRSSR